MKGKIIFLLALAMVLTVDSSAAANVNSINNYVDTVNSLISDKMSIIGITLVMIFSGIMAWKNASIAPLGWGAAASIAIGGSSSLADKLKGLNFS